jgi:hypothetical protein
MNSYFTIFNFKIVYLWKLFLRGKLELLIRGKLKLFQLAPPLYLFTRAALISYLWGLIPPLLYTLLAFYYDSVISVTTCNTDDAWAKIYIINYRISNIVYIDFIWIKHTDFIYFRIFQTLRVLVFHNKLWKKIAVEAL